MEIRYYHGTVINPTHMGIIVIACYRPRPGMADRLRTLTRSHVDRLRAEGLATERQSTLMEAADGTIVEVFEWASREAIENAHSNPNVLAMWEEYAEACEYVPIGEVEEAKTLFSEFSPLESQGYR